LLAISIQDLPAFPNNLTAWPEVPGMTRSRPAHRPEVRRRLVDPARTGRMPMGRFRGFGPGAGGLLLAVMLDAWARRIVGRALSHDPMGPGLCPTCAPRRWRRAGPGALSIMAASARPASPGPSGIAAPRQASGHRRGPRATLARRPPRQIAARAPAGRWMGGSVFAPPNAGRPTATASRAGRCADRRLPVH